jgi:hypothetical protein
LQKRTPWWLADLPVLEADFHLLLQQGVIFRVWMWWRQADLPFLEADFLATALHDLEYSEEASLPTNLFLVKLRLVKTLTRNR